MPKHIKEVLENCINYDVIVGYESPNNDCLTQILIKFYHTITKLYQNQSIHSDGNHLSFLFD